MCRSTIARTRTLLRRTEGQTTAEYAVVLTLVAAASAFLLTELSGRVAGVLNDVAGLLP